MEGSSAGYKNRVAALQNQLKEYQAQIKELKTKNERITIKNLNLKSSIDSTITLTDELTAEKKGLTDKVEEGSALTAYEVLADGIRVKSNGTEIPTKKAKRPARTRIHIVKRGDTIYNIKW